MAAVPLVVEAVDWSRLVAVALGVAAVEVAVTLGVTEATLVGVPQVGDEVAGVAVEGEY